MSRGAKRLQRTLLRHAIDTTHQFAWSGYQWETRVPSSSSGPGPNAWSNSAQNVSINPQTGNLRLGIINANGTFTCSEVRGQHQGYGAYRWTVESLTSPLGIYPVLGLFTYDFETGTQANAYREIDIEFSHWNTTSEKSLVWYTVQPTEPVTRSDHGVSGNLPYTCEFIWQEGQVYFKTTDSAGRTLGEHLVRKNVPIPGTELPIMNLWLIDGKAPTDGNNVYAEIGMFNFTANSTYTPQPAHLRVTDFSTYPDGFALKDGASITNGALQLDNASTYSSAYSGNMYNLVNSSVDIRIESTPDKGNDSNEGLWWLRYDIDNRMAIFCSSGLLFARLIQAGVQTQQSITHDPVNHRYWRIREQANTLYFEVSPDRTTWTLLWSTPHSLGTKIETVQCRFECGHWSNETAPTPLRVGAINKL